MPYRLLLATSLLLFSSLAHADYIKVHEGNARRVAPRPAPAPGDPPRLVYLHRAGGTYTSADHDDSSQNLSGALHFGSPGITEQVLPWQTTDEHWKQTLACSQKMWGRFNVRVTDVDPGTTPHIEAVLTSSLNSDIGFSSGTGGIALLDCEQPVIENAVVWIFPEAFGDDPQRTCEVIAQEVGHTIQLDHELLCKDPMTYLTDCADRSFQDTDADCHDMQLQKAPCACTQAEKQNSVKGLLARLGPGETQPPVVSIQAPAANGHVKPGFTLAAEATDDYVVTQVEIHVDDQVFGPFQSLPKSWTAPRTLPLGAHELVVKAFDPAGNEGSAQVSLTIDSECNVDADCGAQGKVCSAGVCFDDLGSACVDGGNCASGQCGFDPDNHQVCTKNCEGDGDCPSGFTCVGSSIGPVHHCFAGGSGGCALGERDGRGSDSVPVGAAFVVGAALVALRPRGRARRR